jgi:hypothetical protein
MASRRFERTDIEWSNLAPAADERAKRARRALTIDAALAAGVDDNHMVEN